MADKKHSPQGGNEVQGYNNDPKLLERLAQLENTTQLLMKVADRHKLQRHEPKSVGPQRVRVRLFEDEHGEKKLIVGWRMVKDIVTPHTAFDHDTQISEITLHDGTKKQMTFYDFSITYDEKMEVDVLKTSMMPNGQKVYTIEFQGEEYELGESFIN